jgi:hypothetical protein
MTRATPKPKTAHPTECQRTLRSPAASHPAAWQYALGSSPCSPTNRQQRCCADQPRSHSIGQPLAPQNTHMHVKAPCRSRIGCHPQCRHSYHVIRVICYSTPFAHAHVPGTSSACIPSASGSRSMTAGARPVSPLPALPRSDRDPMISKARVARA